MAESDGELLARLGTDAAAWAKEFVRRFGGDEGLMVGWFANCAGTRSHPGCSTPSTPRRSGSGCAPCSTCPWRLTVGDRWAFKLVDSDLATGDRRGGRFRWWPGTTIDVGGTPGGPCPTEPGDGVCLGKTARGLCSGGLSLGRGVLLRVEFDAADVLGEDDEKVRVARCVVGEPGQLTEALAVPHADLREADLRGADLWGANLWGANLRGANLQGVNLWGANLRGANLRGADLQGADLRWANLWGANLRGADLQGADASARTVWPDGFDADAAGVLRG